MSDENENRQLLAIMFTDVVGYTALTESDEASAVRVREAHRDLVRTLVKQFGGEVIDVTGDESLSVFASALRAVDCAMSIQGALRSDSDFRLRIGLHLGDVIRKDGEVIGEGVNTAARIRPLAEPGGICVSEPVYQMVRSRAHVSAQALGSQSLKNVGETLDVYSLTASVPGEARPARKSRRGWIITAIVVVGLGSLGVWRAPVAAWLAVNVPRLTGAEVEQSIAFVTTSDGVQIAYATAGSGPPVVFVLGWGTHLSQGMGSPLYDQGGVLSWWTRDHQVVRYDGRGFGLSDRDVTSMTLDERVIDLESVVDALGLETFVLYAYSAGGATGIAYTARHPERVSRLILAASYAKVDSASSDADAIRSLFAFVGQGWETPAARSALTEFLAPEANEIERSVLMHFLGVAADGTAIVN
ncbi:MAG: class 3 adenylate cyclase, partial [Planctomycetota bacterium]